MIRGRKDELIAYAANESDANKALDLMIQIERKDGYIRELTEDEVLEIIEKD